MVGRDKRRTEGRQEWVEAGTGGRESGDGDTGLHERHVQLPDSWRKLLRRPMRSAVHCGRPIRWCMPAPGRRRPPVGRLLLMALAAITLPRTARAR